MFRWRGSGFAILALLWSEEDREKELFDARLRAEELRA
jgi:hypothetical protein